MSVWVDPLTARPETARWRWPESSHMIADSPDELHAFARKLRLKPEWATEKNGVAHYDLNKTLRRLAVRLGAEELPRRAFVAKLRELRRRP